MSVETDIVTAIKEQIADLVPAFDIYPLKSNTQERPNRFVAIETGLLKQESPGVPYYQLPVSLHIGTRSTGEGGDPDEDVLDAAYEAIQAHFSPRTSFVPRTGWNVAGMVPLEPQQMMSDTHNVRILSYNAFVTN